MEKKKKEIEGFSAGQQEGREHGLDWRSLRVRVLPSGHRPPPSAKTASSQEEGRVREVVVLPPLLFCFSERAHLGLDIQWAVCHLVLLHFGKFLRGKQEVAGRSCHRVLVLRKMKDTSDKVEYTDIGQAVDQVAVSEGNEREAVDVGVRTNAETGITELQSLCMNCQEKGVTRLMLTRIPFFREIIVMSFDCDYCGFHNNEVQFGGEIQEKGCKHVLKVTEREDLNRQVIKADTATITIPELEFEIPAKTQAGLVNTIEGFLTKSASDLRELQEERRKVDPALAQKIDDIIGELTLFAAGKFSMRRSK